MKRLTIVILIMGFILVIACSITAIILMPLAMATLEKIYKAVQELIGIIKDVI